MKIVIAGSSGFVGQALSSYLVSKGNEVTPLTRKKGNFCWNPDKGKLDPALLEGQDAVINLAGENIADGRWTKAKKEKILKSRVNSSSLLRKTIKQLKFPPKVFINASAVGYYDNTGDVLVDEETPAGNDFLAEVCKQWEAAVFPIESKPVRIVIARLGVVLSKRGGVLKKVLGPFKFGLGGIIGSGQQYMSWIELDELCHIFEFLLNKETIFGPVNVVSPYAVTNFTWTKTLGKLLSRPTIFPLPEALAKLIFGEMAGPLLLSSSKVYPKALLAAKYFFLRPNLEDALKYDFKTKLRP